MEKEREQQVYLAKLAEQAERYDGNPPPPVAIRIDPRRSCIFISILLPFDDLAIPLPRHLLFGARFIPIVVHFGSGPAENDLSAFTLFCYGGAESNE